MNAPVRTSAGALAQQARTRLSELLAKAPTEEEGDGAARISLAILNAKSLDEVAAVFGGMDSTEDHVGKSLMVNGFVLRESTFEEGLGVYATIFAENTRKPIGDDDRQVTFNSSSQAVISLLAVANDEEWFPFTATITEKKTRAGFTVYSLVPGE
jgi:hypothetical protein